MNKISKSVKKANILIVIDEYGKGVYSSTDFGKIKGIQIVKLTDKI